MMLPRRGNESFYLKRTLNDASKWILRLVDGGGCLPGPGIVLLLRIKCLFIGPCLTCQIGRQLPITALLGLTCSLGVPA